MLEATQIEFAPILLILVECFSHRSASVAEKMQAQNISIPMAIRTHWNSQYNTVCRVFEIPCAVRNDLLRDVGRSDLALSTHDLNMLQEFAAIYFDLQTEERNCKLLGSL